MVEAQTTDMKLIVFRVESEEYALSIENVGSIEKVDSITRVPGTVEFVKGVINLRGIITPVIDLKQRFRHLPTKLTEHSRIIIVQMEDIVVGLLVDEANNVIDVNGSLIEETPEVADSQTFNYISGVINIEQRLLVLLDVEEILEEQASIEVKETEESI